MIEAEQFEIDFEATENWRTRDIKIFDALPSEVRAAIRESRISFNARKILDLMTENDWTIEHTVRWIRHQDIKRYGHEGR